jgi:hypothetical protein
MSSEFDTLSGRIDRLYDLQISIFDVTRILFGFIIDKGVLTAEEATERLLAHIDEVPADRRDSDKTMALRLLLEIARDQDKSHRPRRRPPQKGRPDLRVVEPNPKTPHQSPSSEKT